MSEFNDLKINRYAGIVLAAGFSSRLKRWKPSLLINNIPMIFYSLKPMLNVCEKIIVVGGHNFKLLQELLNDPAYIKLGIQKVTVAENPGFECGMFSSVQSGLRELDTEYSGVFIVPGDMPLIKEETYIKIKDMFEKSNFDVLIPAVLKKTADEKSVIMKGHPILINSMLVHRIIEEKKEATLRDVIRSSYQEIIPLDDHGISIDVDYESDLEKVLSYLNEKEKQE